MPPLAQGGLLPLDKAKKQKVALIGLDAVVPYTGGSGPSSAKHRVPLFAASTLNVKVLSGSRYRGGKGT